MLGKPQQLNRTDLNRLARQIETASARDEVRFSNVEYLTMGGYSYTFKASVPSTGTLVAIKIPKSDFHSNRQLQRADIVDEGLKIARLGPHENIVPVHGFVRYDTSDRNKRGLVMEFMPGGSLRQQIGGLTGKICRCVSLAIGICRALSVAHEQRPPTGPLVHRDIKPENVLMDDGGNPRLVDFGIASVSAEPEDILGSIPYMAPESIAKGQADPRSDLFSLSVVLYEMIEGRPPFFAEKTTELLAKIRSSVPPAMNADVPAALRRIVERGLEKNPDDRYQSARDMMFDLRIFLAFYEGVLESLEKFERALHAGVEVRSEEVRAFLYLGERYAELAAETWACYSGALEDGPLRATTELRTAVLGALLDPKGGAPGIRSRILDACGAVEDSTASAPAPQSAPEPAPPRGAIELQAIEALLAGGNVLQAEAASRELVSSDAGGELHAQVAALFYRFAVTDQAIAICRDGLDRHAEHAELFAIYGQSLLQAGRREEAARALTKAVEMGAQDPEIVSLRRDLAGSARGDFER